VERLREFFSKRNITIGASGLVVLISTNAVQSAPVGLSTAILTAIIKTTTTIGMTMIHKILIAAMGAAAIGTGIYAFHLRSQIGSLQEEQTLLNGQIELLNRERDAATNRLAALQQENDQLRANESELLALRSEVTRLRQRRNVLPTVTQSETTNMSAEEKISIRLRTKFVSLPAEDLQALGVSWISDSRGGRTGLLTEQQFKIISEALQGAGDVNLISAPQAITLNGGQAQMSVTRSISAGSTNVNTGEILDVIPSFSTNSSTFDLNLNAQLIQLAGDPSQPDVQAIQVTNHVSLQPGQTVILEEEVPPGGWLDSPTNATAEPRSLLVFVTPTIVDSRDFQKPH